MRTSDGNVSTCVELKWLNNMDEIQGKLGQVMQIPLVIKLI